MADLMLGRPEDAARSADAGTVRTNTVNHSWTAPQRRAENVHTSNRPHPRSRRKRTRGRTLGRRCYVDRHLETACRPFKEIVPDLPQFENLRPRFQNRPTHE